MRRSQICFGLIKSHFVKARTHVIALLLGGQPLPRAFGDHALQGEWKPTRDLHLEPDWILIYSAQEDIVRFERTGTHADLFGK